MTMSLSGRARLGLAAAGLFGLSSAAQAQNGHEFEATGGTIPAGAPATTSGPAAPYPMTVNVSGVNAPIGEVRVLLRGLSHTFLNDLNVLLVAPGGRTCVLMANVGGGNPGVTGAEYLFVDGAPSLPGVAPSGRYAPTSSGPTFPAPAPAGPWGTTLSVFKGAIANGTWSLYIFDDLGGDVGTLTGWSLQITEATSVHNPSPMNIPAAGTSGPASIYPSGITVDGVEGPVESVSVMLLGLNHSFQSDHRILLVGPTGQTCLVYGQCGDGSDFVNHTLIIDDNAPGNFPEGNFPSGSYKPTACYGTAGIAFNAPAPAPPYGATLSVFDGLSANGRWRLYIDDAVGGDIGNLAGGWVLSVNGQVCAADFNQSGAVSVQDIFDFLAAYFAGCP